LHKISTFGIRLSVLAHVQIEAPARQMRHCFSMAPQVGVGFLVAMSGYEAVRETRKE
jgi:hypothetical protein